MAVRDTTASPPRRPPQLRARHRRLLGRHGHRRRAARARPLLLLRARLQPVRGRLAVPLLRDLRDRHEPRRRLPRRPLRAEGDSRRRPRHATRRARDARVRPGVVARRAVRDGGAGAVGHREGPDEDELEERRQARRPRGRLGHALPLGRDPDGLEERAQGRRVLRRRPAAHRRRLPARARRARRSRRHCARRSC